MLIGRWNWKAVISAGLIVAALVVAGAMIGFDIWTGVPDPPAVPRAEERADDPQSVLRLCAAFPNESAAQIGLCLGYLKAVAHVLANTAINGQRACIARTTTLGDLRNVVMRFATEHPRLLHQVNTEVVVARALGQAFPCH